MVNLLIFMVATNNCFSNTSQTKTLVIIKCQFSKFQSFRAKIFEMNCFCNYEAIVKCHKFTMSDAFFEDYPIYFLAPANKKYTLIIMRLGDEGADSNKSRRLEVINIQYSWRLHAISASSEWYSWLEVPISLYRLYLLCIFRWKRQINCSTRVRFIGFNRFEGM